MHSRPPLTLGAPPAAAPWRSHPFCRASDIASQARARPFVKRSGRSALGFAPPPDRGVSPGPSGVLLRRVPGVRTGASGQPGQHGETPDHDRRGLPVGARRLLSLPSHPNRRQSGLGPLSSGPHGSAGAPCRPQETSRDVEGPSRLRRAGPSVGGGHFGAPETSRDVEGRHGSAGAARALGGWGPSRGPHVNQSLGAISGPPCKSNQNLKVRPARTP